MSTSVYCPHSKHIDLPCIRRVDFTAPATWLNAGWSDLRRAWPSSLPYGIALGALGFGLVYFLAGRPQLTMALIGGFLLLGPALAAGFYQISRRLEWQDSGRIGAKPPIGRLFGSNTALFGLALAVVFAVWINLSMMLTALLSSPELATGETFSLLALFSPDNLPFVLSYLTLGAVLAVLVFSASVTTLPMLMDRQTDVATAVMTSLIVVRANLAAMAVWALIIAVLMLAGMVSLFIGFAVFFPVIGHATWHAYRELVERG